MSVSKTVRLLFICLLIHGEPSFRLVCTALIATAIEKVLFCSEPIDLHVLHATNNGYVQITTVGHSGAKLNFTHALCSTLRQQSALSDAFLCN